MSHLSSTQSQKLRILSRLPVMRMGKVLKIVLGCLQAKKQPSKLLTLPITLRQVLSVHAPKKNSELQF